MEKQLEILDNHLILIIIGSILGSTKANIRENVKWHERIINWILGMFCGIALGLEYNLEKPMFSGLIALSASMLGTNILEAFLILSPKQIRKIILKYLGIDK